MKPFPLILGLLLVLCSTMTVDYRHRIRELTTQNDALQTQVTQKDADIRRISMARDQFALKVQGSTTAAAAACAASDAAAADKEAKLLLKKQGLPATPPAGASTVIAD
ncbi:hypothetical protein F6X40_11245 [Paraburkholderia sp. UCT31]|uniref:hypothetical protein n=1 Tax=Paraburkholderia sp. UCT31 TaxID=2615209 RepID=UPI0016560430|nr:hypothetical protein [Paraburkholderia sp. UCT31]MBC8737379.1 hypothetical protein [Paraburkholderia sp. UCT31]